MYKDYDDFAWVYNRYWGSTFSHSMVSVVERLITPLPPHARLLDVACGSGQFAHFMTEKGYQVTGIDGSEALIAFARENAPAAEFIHADAREFRLPPSYHAATSFYDSLNHLLTLEDMKTVFQNVYHALLKEGWFLFDLNTEDSYEKNWRTSFNIIQDDHVIAVQSSYQASEKLGIFKAVIFRLENNENWRRKNIHLTQRCYAVDDIISALREVGFDNLQTINAQEVFQMDVGRTFFLGRKL
ncbi:MAG: methyltransferase domain-containing protein [Taibaiella sp.]|nr:methyltransferase domain-containing protein [Taibaiella sp.]